MLLTTLCYHSNYIHFQLQWAMLLRVGRSTCVSRSSSCRACNYVCCMDDFVYEEQLLMSWRELRLVDGTEMAAFCSDTILTLTVSLLPLHAIYATEKAL